MSINIVKSTGSSTRNLNSRSLNESVGYYDPDALDYYSEPDEWPDMPHMSSGENKIVMFARVDPTLDPRSNTISFRVAVNSGNVNIDWGDGTTDSGNYGSITTSRSYDLSTKNLISVSDLSTGESPSAGYGIAVITITPGISTAYFTSFSRQTNTFGGSVANSGSVLSIKMSAPLLTTLNVNYSGLRKFEYVGINSISSAGSLFSAHRHLEKVTFDISNIGSGGYSNMFATCYRLTDVNLTGNPRNLATRSAVNMFNECKSLRRAPNFSGTNLISSMVSMFNGCNSLEYIPLYTTTSCISMSSMFHSCFSLENVPLFNTFNVTNMTSMFSGCTALEIAPFFNTSNVTTVSGMFFGCFNLKYVPSYNLTSCTNISNMFFDCVSLRYVPDLSVKTPALGATFMNATGVFFNNQSLISIGFIDLSAVNNNSQTFINSSSPPRLLQRSLVTGHAYNHTYINCNLSPEALNEIYTNLPTAASGSIITVTGNWGTAYDDPTIATGKGWTVTS